MNDLALDRLVRQSRLRSRLGSAALMAALLVVAAPKAVSQGIKPTPAPTISGLKAELDALRAELLAERNARIGGDNSEAAARTGAINIAVAAEKNERVAADATEKTLRAQADLAFSNNLDGLSNKIFNVQTDVADLKHSLQSLVGPSDLKLRVEDLEKKTRYIQVLDHETIFTNTNVHIENGQGATATTNGLGNLIVGYNAPTMTTRSGSHNVVVGDRNGYSSFGGLVVGENCESDGAYSSAFGTYSKASGDYSFAFGDSANATGICSGVFGGYGGWASGTYGVVTGGENLMATTRFEYNYPRP